MSRIMNIENIMEKNILNSIELNALEIEVTSHSNGCTNSIVVPETLQFD